MKLKTYSYSFQGYAGEKGSRGDQGSIVSFLFSF